MVSPTLKRLWRYLRPHRLAIAIAVLCMVGGTAGELAAPLFIKYFIDDIVARRNYGPLTAFLGLLICVLMLAALLQGLRDRIMHILGSRFIHRIRTHAYAALQRLSLSYFEDTPTGDIMSRLSDDVNSLENLVVHSTDTLIVDTLRLMGAAVILFVLDWRVALAALIPVPAILFGFQRFARPLRRAYRAVRDQLGDLNARLQDNIQGIRVIQAFSAEEKERERIYSASEAYSERYIEVIKLWTTVFPALSMIAALGIPLIIGVGAHFIRQGTFTVGEMIAFLAYAAQFYTPVRNLTRTVDVVQRALAAADRVFELMDRRPDIEDAPDARELGPIAGEVELRDVYFRYSDGEEVLAGITLRARPGERIALVGRSGAGKSSILNLIPRFYDPIQGQVLVDGHDVRKVTQASLRSQIALVLQETFLFNDTVWENIAYGFNGAPSPETIEAAARAAHAHDFIVQLPKGYGTPIGERGVKLSGGERQRLAIARALLADPKILLLDEATSSVDSESELLIHDALDGLMRGRTTFIIAHRLSTVRNAGRIIVIEEGSIAEEGSHEELLACGGIYSQLYAIQFDIPERQ